jgi:ABC-type Fe3+/spermidine/putrescine transport system ATPase subunit
LAGRPPESGGLPASIVSISFLGAATRYTLQLDDTTLTALTHQSALSHAPGDSVRITWDSTQLHSMSDEA